MDNDNLKKAEQIAKDKAEEFKKAAEAKDKAKKEAESKGAAKAEETKGKESILAEAEKQAQNDARILSAKDEELSVEDKTRKAELVKAKTEASEDKIKRETQKRIDEIISELKSERAERNKDKEKIEALESKLETLTKPKAEEDIAVKVKQIADQQTAKYLDEDKVKPKEQKREMTKEELEDWLLDDYVAATEWLTDRNIRRREDREKIVTSLNEAPKRKAEEFIKKQQESLKKLITKYPLVVPSPERLAELKGKSKNEIDQILASENEDYKLMLDIVQADPKKYLESVDGPEQVMAEMDKRKPSKKVITLTEDELAQKIKDAAIIEAQRIAGLDIGLTSSGGRKMEKVENKSALRLEQERVAKKAGIPLEKLDFVLKRRADMGLPESISSEEFKKE